MVVYSGVLAPEAVLLVLMANFADGDLELFPPVARCFVTNTMRRWTRTVMHAAIIGRPSLIASAEVVAIR